MRAGRPDRSHDSDRSLLLGFAVALSAFVVYLAGARSYDAGRPDFFYLADAFLHGRTYLPNAPGPWDVVAVGSRIFVPFAPFPAIALMPLIAIVGPALASEWQPIVNSSIAGADLLLVWVLAGRLGVRSLLDRLWLALLFGFSTQIWWIVTRGGVWHTGQLVAGLLTLAALVEAFGRRRPLLLGLLIGAAFLSRAPLALAAPYFAWVIIEAHGRAPGLRRLLAVRRWPWGRLGAYALGVAPSVLFFLWYNAVRFGSPLDSGYAEASLPDWLAKLRAHGLFSPTHLAMNVDYLFLKLPTFTVDFPWIQPDGLGMSILFTSPGLLLALGADWRRRSTVALGLTAVTVLVPSLLYYGGGWLQFGYRYALDCIPFVVALCAMAASRTRRISWRWRFLVAFGVLVGAESLYWAFHLG